MPKPVRKMQKANAAAQAAVLPKIPPREYRHGLWTYTSGGSAGRSLPLYLAWRPRIFR